MPTPDITELTADLRALGGQRVWSLMISLFGDLAQGKGESIEGPVLSAIMTALEVKPEASRVALYRLRNDGWITSTKAGRISRHGLTPKGRAQSIAASPQIYALPKVGTADWQVVILPDTDAPTETQLTGAGFVRVMPRVFVGARGMSLPDRALVLDGAQAPGWLYNALIPDTLLMDYEAMLEPLTSLSDRLPEPAKLKLVDMAVLRCLVVHNWRRLVLKHAAPPPGLIDTQSAYYRCHLLVADILARYPRPSLTGLAQEQAGA